MFRPTRKEHKRLQKVNVREAKRVLREVQAAAVSCPFHHSSQPSVPLGGVQNETRNDCESAAECDEFMNVDVNGRGSSGRSLVGDIAAFCIKWKVTREASNELLQLLSAHGVRGLPRDSRACKRSLRVVENVVGMGGGSYYHFGVEKELIKNLALYEGSCDSVHLQFSIDGLPLFRSSPVDFWPILCRVFLSGNISSVFPVGLYCGKSKPSDVDEYLKLFLQEMTAILERGIEWSGVHANVFIHSFVCDAPARQYIKKIKGHSGYDSCERCEIHGERNESGEPGIKFVQMCNTGRSDDLFRENRYGCHQKSHLGASPLNDLPIDMIKDFPLDYMHLVLLGVVKRMLRLWLGTTDFHVTKYSCNFRLLARECSSVISERVQVCSESVSSEFQRRPRQMDENKFFKAKEFRTLLLYTFPFIFRGLFRNNSKVYDHFLLLVVSFRIMLGRKPTPNFIAYVRALLVKFVRDMKDLYGKTHMTYSVHNLLHVVDDYERFGVLDRVSAFSFESYMQKLKGYVGRGGQELQQAVKRRHEEGVLDIGTATSSCDVALKKEHDRGPLGKFSNSPVESQFGEVMLGGRRFTVESRDSFVCVGSKFGRIKNFIRIDNKLYTLVQYFESVENFFTSPCCSDRVGIVLCKSLRDELVAVDLQKVQKCVAFEMKESNNMYVAKLLHETIND